jgi:hypothetical protein
MASADDSPRSRSGARPAAVAIRPRSHPRFQRSPAPVAGARRPPSPSGAVWMRSHVCLPSRGALSRSVGLVIFSYQSVTWGSDPRFRRFPAPGRPRSAPLGQPGCPRLLLVHLRARLPCPEGRLASRGIAAGHGGRAQSPEQATVNADDSPRSRSAARPARISLRPRSHAPIPAITCSRRRGKASSFPFRRRGDGLARMPALRGALSRPWGS